MGEADEEGVIGFGNLTDQDDSDDQTVDTEHTSHNNRNDATHDELGTHDTHGGDSNAGLCCSICGAQVGEDEGGGGTGEAEEGGGGITRHFEEKVDKSDEEWSERRRRRVTTGFDARVGREESVGEGDKKESSVTMTGAGLVCVRKPNSFGRAFRAGLQRVARAAGPNGARWGRVARAGWARGWRGVSESARVRCKGATNGKSPIGARRGRVAGRGMA
ncbi:V-type H+-transporting ATPase subunit c [Gracilaria domingensis]|nr:V-type H+-transporting ATPase subunit c [Gracilaria domingensis]